MKYFGDLSMPILIAQILLVVGSGYSSAFGGGIGRGFVNRSLIHSATTCDCQCVGPVRRTSSGRSRFSVVGGPRRSRLGNNVFELGQTCDVSSHKESEWMLEKMASAFFAGTAARAEGCLQVELR